MVAILLVPQAIAYSYLAGMPPEYGLYTALIPCILYAILGTSPHLAVGPVAVSALLVMAGISQLAEPFSENYIGLVILSGLLIGVLQFIMGIFRLGALVNLLSYPVITGFTSAASVIVIVNQLKDIFGLHIPQSDFLFDALIHIVNNLSLIQGPTLLIGLSTFMAIIVLKKTSKKIPYGLIVVFTGIILSYFFNFEKLGVDVIGSVPSGLPTFKVPNLDIETITSLLPTVFLVTIIGIIEAVSIAKAIGNKHDYYTIDTNQELRALGISKIGGSFFNSIPSSGSFSRSALMNESGARSSIASLIAVVFVVLALLFLTPFLFFLPKVILAIIIVFAVKNLFEYALAKSFFRTNKLDFSVMLITFIITLFVSIMVGVLVGFLASIIVVLINSKNKQSSLKRLFLFRESEGIIIDKTSAKLIVSVSGQLNFGNADYFTNMVKEKVATNVSFNTILIDLTLADDIDSSGLKALKIITKYAISANIEMNIDNYNKKVKPRLQRSGLI
ncbi:MAG: SulP family sulfate permease [Saprospiraceae bacterium]|jgi:SulP family sulfate permease